MTIKLNLISTPGIKPSHHLYIPSRVAKREGMCRCQCPEAPYYRCTRAKGHEKQEGEGNRDHAAHGVNGEIFAIWSEE
jgi:hypothetical protein